MINAEPDHLRTFKGTDLLRCSPGQFLNRCGSATTFAPVFAGGRAWGLRQPFFSLGCSQALGFLKTNTKFLKTEAVHLGVNVDVDLVFGFCKYELYGLGCLLTYELIKAGKNLSQLKACTRLSKFK